MRSLLATLLTVLPVAAGSQSGSQTAPQPAPQGAAPAAAQPVRDPARAVAITRGLEPSGPDAADPAAQDSWTTLAAGVQIEPGLWLTPLPLRSTIRGVQMEPVCCGAPETLQIASLPGPVRLSLVRTTIDDQLASLPVAAAKPAEDEDVRVCIAVKGTGVMGATIALGVVSEWPGLGLCGEIDVPMSGIVRTVPVLNAEQEVCGFVVGSAGTQRSLIMLVDQNDIAPIRAAAFQRVDDAWSLEPSAAERTRYEADAAENRRDHKAAAAIRKAAGVGEQSDFRSLWRLAVNLDLSGKGAEAEAVATKVTQIAPRFSEAWHSLGLIRFRSNDFVGAAEALAKAVEVEPKYYAAAGTRAVALAQLGRVDEAIEILDDLADKDLENPSFLNNSVLLMDRTGKQREATERCRRFTADHPDALHGWELLAKRLDDAEQHAAESIIVRTHIKRLNPDDLGSRLMLGLLLGRIGNADASRRELNEVLAIDPENQMAVRILRLLDQEEAKRK